MKQNTLAHCIMAALALTTASVNAEDKYPASDFQPTVVYQDDSASKSPDSNSSKSGSSSSSSSSSEYPAANFQPKVVYEDESYKHADIPARANSSSNTTSNDVSSSSATSVSSVGDAKKDDSSLGYILGLAALLGAGFFLFNKGKLGAGNKTSSSNASSVNYSANAGGPTGVSRYLLKISGTGVSRYIEKNVKAASSSTATGVSKYLAKQGNSSSAKTASTGVEKYLKNKG